MVNFTLYSRSYCHLCDDFLQALQALSSEYVFTVTVLDIDMDNALLHQYDELVPVLFGSHDSDGDKDGDRDGESRGAVQLCHYHLDEAVVRAFLQ